MPFDSREYEWADVSVNIGGRDITGIRAIKYEEDEEAEGLYAKGRNPHSIQTGNRSYKGELIVTQSEYEALVKAGSGSVLNLRNLAVMICYGNPVNGDTLITDKLLGLKITKGGKDFKQGQKYAEITLPFLATLLVNQSL